MTRLTTLALSLSVAALLGACGLKGDLYLPAKQPATTPAPTAPATPAPAKKAGDDSKAAQTVPAAK